MEVSLNSQKDLKRWLALGLKAAYLSVLCVFLLASVQFILDLFRRHELMVNYHGDQLEFSDFLAFYMLGQIAVGPDAHRLYEPATQLAYFNRLLAPYSVDKPFFAECVPFVSVLMIPFTWLRPENAYLMWLGLTVVFGMGALFLWLRRERSLNLLQVGTVLLATAASFPGLLSLRMGQQGWNVMGLVSLFWWGFCSGKDFMAALGLALLSFKPQYVFFFAIAALVSRRWKLMLWAILIEAILLCVSGTVVGWQNVLLYPQMVLHADTTSDYYGVNEHKMVSMRVLTTLLLPRQSALLAALVIMLVGLLATSLIWWKTVRARLTSGYEQRWAIALTVILCLICSPHAHCYDLMMLAALAFTLAPQAGKQQPLSLPPAGRDGTASRLPPFAYSWWCICLCLYPVATWVVLLGAAIGNSVPFLAILLVNCLMFCFALALWKAELGQRKEISAVALAEQ